VISKDRYTAEACISSPVDANCDGCAYCVNPCPYDAITLLEYMSDGSVKKTVEVNTSLCKGCGSCSAACLNGAIRHLGFTDGQILAMIKALGE